MTFGGRLVSFFPFAMIALNVIVFGYNNNVTYHSGAPKVTDSGYSNNIQQG